MTSAEPNTRAAGALRGFLSEFLAFAGRKAVSAMMLLALAALLEGFGLTLVVPFIQILSGGHIAGGRLQRLIARLLDALAVHTALGQLAFVLVFITILMILRTVISSLRDVSLAKLQMDFLAALQLRLAQGLANSRWERINRLRHARIVHVMGADMLKVSVATSSALQCAVATILLAVQCTLVVALSPLLAATALCLLVLGGAALFPVTARAGKQGKHLSTANRELSEGMAKFLGGLKLAMSGNLQAGFVLEFAHELGELSRGQLVFIRSQASERLAFAALTSVAGTAAFLVGFGVLHSPGALLITFLLIVTRMSGVMSQLHLSAELLAQSLPAYEHVKELEGDLATGDARMTMAAALEPDNFTGMIMFDEVSYLHSGQDTEEASLSGGVRNLTLTIESGAFVGVSGPSGCGKTTFADLLVGLLAPQRGQILLDGANLSGETLVRWRNQVGYVGQEPFLFHDSVRRNLSWANRSASEADLWAALALSGADRLVRQMDGGLDGIVGERGSLLSGGERQRLALARAVLRNPKILVLDEATNAIDIAAEGEIIARLLAMRPRPTIVMIAHRPESIALCDQILVFEGGRLVAEREPSIIRYSRRSRQRPNVSASRQPGEDAQRRIQET